MKNDFTNGFIANIPIGVSVAVYGSICGMLNAQHGVGLYEMVLMNVFIFAGTSQFVIVNMWSSSLDILGIILAASVINLRYFLIGASLNSLFLQSSKKEKFAYMHLVADENWAVTMGRLRSQALTPLFLFGGGVYLLLVWNASTIFGYFLGGFIQNPTKYALDFAFVSIFVALVSTMYRGKSDILPWCITALVALLCEVYLPGKFYIVLGALAGSLSGVYLQKGCAS